MSQRNDTTLCSLVETSSISPFIRGEIEQLIERMHHLKAAAAELETVKNRLRDLIMEEGLVTEDGVFGARCGDRCVTITERAGRETFDKSLAVEAGITPAQIKASMKRGNSFFVVEIGVIGAGEPVEEHA